MVIIVFGVAGAGKTLIGSLLAAELGWEFYDADLFHSPESVEKMKRGLPLADTDREPWLERLCDLLRKAEGAGDNVVLACSALKESYRRRLRGCASDARLVYLKGDYALISRRLEERRGHFMPPTLLKSQFETMEEPQDAALVVDVLLSPREIVRTIREGLGLQVA